MTAQPENPIEVMRGVVYAVRPERELCADLYLPAAGTQPAPVIVWLHGGGWRFGNRRQAPDLGRFFAARGYAMVAIDYRLSAQAIFPAAVEDVKAAIRWLKSVAADYRLDPARIGLWGSSAGGHLAALAAISRDDQFRDELFSDFTASVAAVACAYPPVDFLQMDAHRDPSGKPSDDVESIQLPPGMLSANADSLESLFLGAPIESRPDLVAAANPINYLTPAGTSHTIPPFLILHGLSDTAVPYHQSILLFDALAANGGTAELDLIEGLGHGFCNRNHLDDRAWNCDVRVAANGSVRGELATKFVMRSIGDWFDKNL